MRCGDCKFWADHARSPQRLFGWCKRLPPVRYLEIMPATSTTLIGFGNRQGCPEVLSDDWCGEFALREGEPRGWPPTLV